MYRTLLAALMPLALGLRGTSESLRKALVNVGLELTEQHLYGQQRSEEAPPFMVLMPGLARGCHSTELMRSYLSSCRAGTSALTMVFQFGHRTGKSPNDVLPRSCRWEAARDAKLKELRSEMRARGYLLIDRNDNPFCGHCSEVLFALENATA